MRPDDTQQRILYLDTGTISSALEKRYDLRLPETLEPESDDELETEDEPEPEDPPSSPPRRRPLYSARAVVSSSLVILPSLFRSAPWAMRISPDSSRSRIPFRFRSYR